ncbi:TolC family protein [Campylobacter cuniculorum]|uniref:TolC-like outer membrane efflux protein n=2 Tax=Campylobacter cuniculorum TaxID=374106 RepID=A0A1W6BX98_9BACT|nr:TolC family protein [Campylobacter cuniculorum]ARJ56736.1 TolC-like outer membrane efflux protein [Campylobacter cuniculorum DSM 23162 = LMG 24588]QOR04206.1 TolC family protein [Campylobacter cuniculorum]
MKKICVLILSILLSACGVKLSEVHEKTINANEIKDLNLSKEWWRAYKDDKIDEFIDFVLQYNSDINIARTTFLSMVARADLIDYDLYPSLSGNLGLNGSKDLNSGQQNKSFSNSLNLSYELDIYGKILDSSKARELSAKASAYDLENLKLSIINSSINGIFELAYFNDVENLLLSYKNNLEQMKELYQFKYELGKIEELDLLNIEQNLLRAKQNLISNEQNRDLLIKNLQDLIGNQKGFKYIEYFKNLSLAHFKELKPNFDLPLEILSYRPDVKAKLNNLKAAFKDYSSVQKSLLPSINLGGGLSGRDRKFDESFKFEILNGVIEISLPFLDFGRVRQNIKISQYAYEALLFEYEQILQSAINEFMLNYKDYQNVNMLLENLKIINLKQEQITKAYLQKYEAGKSELKDYLDASNALNSSQQEFLRARFNLLSTINSYYQITTIDDKELKLN